MFKEIRYKLITSYYLIKERGEYWRENPKKRKKNIRKEIIEILTIISLLTAIMLQTKQFINEDKPNIVNINNYENCIIIYK